MGPWWRSTYRTGGRRRPRCPGGDPNVRMRFDGEGGKLDGWTDGRGAKKHIEGTNIMFNKWLGDLCGLVDGMKDVEWKKCRKNEMYVSMQHEDATSCGAGTH